MNITGVGLKLTEAASSQSSNPYEREVKHFHKMLVSTPTTSYAKSTQKEYRGKFSNIPNSILSCFSKFRITFLDCY